MNRFSLLAVLVALVVCGCGSSQREFDLGQAVKRTEATGSTRLQLRGESTVGTTRTPISCAGLADYTRRRSQMSCHLGDSTRLDVIGIGDMSYMRISGSGLGQLSDGKWMRDPGQPGDGLQDLTPAKLLALLRSAEVGSERVGGEDVRGEPSDHYRLTVDAKKAQFQDSGLKTAQVDVWIGQEGILRRVRANDNGPFTIEFFDFGVTVDIEPPPASEIEQPEQPVQAAPLPPCGGVRTSPITVEEALAALRRNGFSIDESGQSCGTAGNVAMLISNGTSGTATVDREGALTCVLLRKADGISVLVGSRNPEARLRLANLNCTLAVVGNAPDPGPRLAKLRKAFADLRQLIRP